MYSKFWDTHGQFSAPHSEGDASVTITQCILLALSSLLFWEAKER